MANRTPKTLPARSRNADKPSAPRKSRLKFNWAKGISDDQWECYQRAIHAIRDSGTPFLLGGGFAMAAYAGRWRNTKDIDFYIRKEDREKAIESLTRAGFEDYYSTLPYDRRWIYRSTCSGVIVDIIWAMANQRAQVDEQWFEKATPILIRKEALAVVPLEEFIWCKLYIMQRDHCDWTDILNVLFTAGNRVDWKRLLSRLEEDWPLLKGLLSVYGWLCPRRAQEIPPWLHQQLGVDRPTVPRRSRFNRIRLLDSRGWFAALIPKDKPLEI